jgi:hypothetical protein
MMNGGGVKRWQCRRCSWQSETFAGWLADQTTHLPNRWIVRLMWVGIVDTVDGEDGGLAMLRWDFWNSRMRALVREKLALNRAETSA